MTQPSQPDTPSYSTVFTSPIDLLPATSDRADSASAQLDRWRGLPIAQQPDWGDAEELEKVRQTLQGLPPLVFAGEVDTLRERLAAVARGEAFLLQGGDCAESFNKITADNISRRVRTILQMSVVLTYAASMPTVKMGRMAGQFAKPRSAAEEIIDGRAYPVYRGDIVNGHGLEERVADPWRMVRGYQASASTLNLVRAFTQGGFAHLSQVHRWNRGFAANSAEQRYQKLATEIERAIRFMGACGVDSAGLSSTELFTCHEGLVLEYERALTRVDSRTGLPYDTSAHFLWIGERTRQLDGAHLEFFSRIQNPLGVKLGPAASRDDLLRLVERLDPERTPGRLTFITRMGASRVEESLLPLLRAAREEGLAPLWVCDPMHGNTISAGGYKTRRFSDIIAEVRGFFAAHRHEGTVAGGLHVELTGNDVTECLGGSEEINESDLARNYESLCDPRLSHRQALELAFLVAEELQSGC